MPQVATKDLKAGELPAGITSPNLAPTDNDGSITNSKFVNDFFVDNAGTFTTDFTNTGTVKNPIIQLTVAPSTKQDLLVSGTNIKSLNGVSILGSGNLVLGGSQTPWTANVDAAGFSLTDLKEIEIKIVSAGVTYTTWNPSDINSNMVLTGGNLIISGNGSGGFQLGRAGLFLDSTNRQWEITTNIGGSLRIGIADLTESVNARLGDGTGGYAYSDSGQKVNNSSASSYGAGGYGSPGDIITVYWEGSTRSLGFKVNGTDYGFAYTGIPAGNFYPALSTGLGTYTFTANFGFTSFAHPVSGYVGVSAAGGGGTIDVLKTDAVTGNITLGNIQNFASNAAAITGGLTTGMLYRNGDSLNIVH